MSEELKPCPFCGCQATSLTDAENVRIIGSHGAACPFRDVDVTVDSRDAWNTRTALKAGQGEAVEAVAWRWKTDIPEQLRGSDWMWSFGSHWSTGPKDAEKLMTVAQHERIVAAMDTHDPGTVQVPIELVGRITKTCYPKESDVSELRALLARYEGDKS